MATSIQPRFYQRAAGQPLQASCRVIFSATEDWNAAGPMGFGVKATSALPEDTTDFGGHTRDAYGSTTDYTNDIEREIHRPGDVVISSYVVQEYGAAITLDASWAAGHYVFAFVAASADGSTILASSAPYRIR